MNRYSVINNKNKREIVLLRGSGCKWKKCTFCDYHKDFCVDDDKNYLLNKNVLKNVTGIYNRLEVINSGSFCDLDAKTIEEIIVTCKEKNITKVHFECHYLHRDMVKEAKKLFLQNSLELKIKTGVETFDTHYREKVLKKGFGFATPQQIAEYADEVCLLFGLDGQTKSSMLNDVETGLKYFQRVCINIMCENTTDVKPNEEVINVFMAKIYPLYKDNKKVDILCQNTDFGVGSNSDLKEEL